MSISNYYASELDADTVSQLRRSAYASRLPVCTLAVPASAISPEETEWLHCVEAKKDGNIARIRVITSQSRGVNINVPLISKEMVLKYYDLRFRIRNSDYVKVVFPQLYIHVSPYAERELFITAKDFKNLEESGSQEETDDFNVFETEP